ncbi:MAG: hydrogenase maturation nickel metallochaperone HypA [Thermodesulfobacteriota bacterium]
MHEASLALSILETVCGQCRQQGFHTIHSVRLRIGQAAGVVADCLDFAFLIAREDFPAARKATLVIEQVPLGGTCHDCGRGFVAAGSCVLHCPHCHSARYSLSGGFEFDIVDMEVD